MKRSILFLAAALLLSGAGLTARSILRLEPAHDIDRTMGAWRYTVRVTAKGTRSEGKTGQLFYKRRQIPARFHEIQINMGKFLFFEGKHRWGPHGWIRESGESVNSLGQVRKILPASYRQRGWYRGKLQLIRTPKSWVRVRRGSEYYWVSPLHLDRLAAAKKWSLLHAHAGQRWYK